jgi:hypothetical protein
MQLLKVLLFLKKLKENNYKKFNKTTECGEDVKSDNDFVMYIINISFKS